MGCEPLVAETGELAGRMLGHLTRPVRRPLQRCVVDQDEMTVASAMYIELETVRPIGATLLHGVQGFDGASSTPL